MKYADGPKLMVPSSFTDGNTTNQNSLLPIVIWNNTMNARQKVPNCSGAMSAKKVTPITPTNPDSNHDISRGRQATEYSHKLEMTKMIKKALILPSIDHQIELTKLKMERRVTAAKLRRKARKRFSGLTSSCQRCAAHGRSEGPVQSEAIDLMASGRSRTRKR